jgi:hypothetical protein
VPDKTARKQTATFIVACCVCWSFDRATTVKIRANNTTGRKEPSFMDHPLSTSTEGSLGQENEKGAAKFLLTRSDIFLHGGGLLNNNKRSKLRRNAKAVFQKDGDA